MSIFDAELVQEQADGSCPVLQRASREFNPRPACADGWCPVGRVGDSFTSSALSACLAGVIKPINSQLVGMEAVSERASTPLGNLQ